MYNKEIDILTTVFGEYFIYINAGEKTANSRNIEFNYDYIINLARRNILIIKFNYGSIKCFLLSTELERFLKRIEKSKLMYVTDPVLHIYREKKIEKLIQN
tara:strand:+ start:3805 stop:4107 length:303 start_codon:yes stop_codon:yes gene_type:complete